MKKDIESREDIVVLVDEFYKKVLKDDTISYFFTDVVKLDWQKHIPVMYDFWESILLGGTAYQGNPMTKHIDLDQKSRLEEKHFERWLKLFGETIRDHFEGPKSDEAFQRAGSIAGVIQFKLKSLRKS